MNVLVIGLGSMGRRRIRLMKQLDLDLIIVGVDSNKERCQMVSEEFGIECYHSVDEAFTTIAVVAAFVCTSPLSHATIIPDLLDRKVHVFTEINLVADAYEEIIKKAKKIGKTVFLSSTFLYRKDIEYIIKKVENQRVNYQYHSGQYLPDWHPWENYQNFFVADKRTNGCREIMAIEFPWIIKCFGKVKNVTVLKDKMSGLHLDYCDNYLLLLEHENGNKGQIIVDVVSRKARRTLEVYGEDVQIFWDGTPDSLKEYAIDNKELENIATYSSIDKNANYCDNIIENAYMEEIVTFFNVISGKSEVDVKHDFLADLEILTLINQIEE